MTRSFRYDFLDQMAARSDAVASRTGVCPAESLGPWAAAHEYVAGTDRIASRWEPDLAGKRTHAFGYDGEGNVSAIGRYDAAGASIAAAVCLRHDPLGRLVFVGTTGTAVTPGGTACTSDGEVLSALGRYRYDGRQRRVSREVGAEWTAVVADAWGNPLSELRRAGTSWTTVRDYVWLDGRLLAQVEYEGATGRTYYAHLDHLGTPRALTNQAGQLVWSTFQRPYGEVGEKTIPDPLSGKTVVTNLRLPGQYDERLLGSLGLQGPYYNWNRWYLPGVGRYLELDPIALRGGFNGEHGPDWYNYVDGNPLRWTDPAGKGVSRDKLWCMESVGCPKAIYCGGTKLDLTSCGTGCDRCPTLPGSVFTNDWCAYAETKSSCGGKTGALFKPAIGGLDIGWIQVCYP